MSIEDQRWMAAERLAQPILVAGLCVLFSAATATTGSAAQLASASYDVSTYIFRGGTPDIGNEDDPELPILSVNTDYTGGVVSSFNSHVSFFLIRFDDLSGIATKASGGPDKYLTLSASGVPVPSVIGVSIANQDITSSTEGYPGRASIFPGNPTGTSVDRLQWYMDNIKGDDPTYGSYAGGATHVGVLTVTEPGDYSIDVTAAVDAWIEGLIPNYGFGLWGVEGADPFAGELTDFVSMHNDNGIARPTLQSLPIGGTVPGDFDEDGDVDGDDFLIWQSEFGGGDPNPRADGDGDGDVDGDDFLVWQSSFGSAAGGAASVVNVPEPSGIAMALLLAAALMMVARRMVPGSGCLLARTGLPLGALGSLNAQRSVGCCLNSKGDGSGGPFGEERSR